MFGGKHFGHLGLLFPQNVTNGGQLDFQDLGLVFQFLLFLFDTAYMSLEVFRVGRIGHDKFHFLGAGFPLGLFGFGHGHLGLEFTNLLGRVLEVTFQTFRLGLPLLLFRLDLHDARREFVHLAGKDLEVALQITDTGLELMRHGLLFGFGRADLLLGFVGHLAELVDFVLQVSRLFQFNFPLGPVDAHFFFLFTHLGGQVVDLIFEGTHLVDHGLLTHPGHGQAVIERLDQVVRLGQFLLEIVDFLDSFGMRAPTLQGRFGTGQGGFQKATNLLRGGELAFDVQNGTTGVGQGGILLLHLFVLVDNHHLLHVDFGL
mmetsp:Transcript_4300/g.8746  ORF Transcript_4300/g.8746 Transcript_4300/m.8746 type:complete len:316 (-) Transcript_4300:1098-2045(-)